MGRVQRLVTITGAHGLHARPATTLVQSAGQYSSEIVLRKGEREANAKSLISLLTLGAAQGDQVELIPDGSDSEEVVRDLALLLSEGA